MQVCEEYGTKLLASPDNDSLSDSSPVTNLTYTQALILKQRELEAAKEEAPSARKIAELEKKLKDAESKYSVRTTEAQFNIHRDNMIKAYDELLKMLTALDRTDPEVKEKYRETASMIVENMAKSLKVCRTNLSIDTTQSERG